MRRLLGASALLAWGLAGCASAAAADDQEVDGDLQDVSIIIQIPSGGAGSELDEPAGSTGGPVPVLTPACGHGGEQGCATVLECVANGEEGTLHDVRVDGELVGTVCVTDAVGERLGVVTPGMVLTEFRRLTWPGSELVVQPPRGRIPVNLDGYFFTRDTAPLTQTVTLLGRQIQIEATPEEFTWHFGDGTTATTASPGGPYPGGDVTHRYTDDGDVTPSLDTTYRGRYRVDGGAWTAIPATHTVTGEPQTLNVITVDLELVDPSGVESSYRCGSYC